MEKFIIVLIILNSFNLFSQECGTETTTEDINHVLSLDVPVGRSSLVNLRSNHHQIPININIVVNSQGEQSIVETEVIEALEGVDKAFANSGLSFYVNPVFNYISNDILYDLDKTNEGQILFDDQDALNIYFVNSLKSNGANICGYTRSHISGKNRIFISYGCSRNGSTLIHEIGHYLSLIHTHGTSGTPTELVNGVNCEIAGDLICDTPADPNLNGKIQNCEYRGGEKDSNGYDYWPDISNYMSYAPSNCRNHFTDGQKAHMFYSWDSRDSVFTVPADYITLNELIQLYTPIDFSIDLFNVYPNPSNGKVTVSIDTDIRNLDLKVTMLDVNGFVVYTSDVFSNMFTIDIPKSGFYVLNIFNDKVSIVKTIVNTDNYRINL